MYATDSPLVRRGLKISHLRMLAALADTGQIGLAADRLGIAQPAASRLLAEVERITGQPVHARTGRGVALTPPGAALARRAQRMLMELRDADRELAELTAGGAGHVRIGAVTGPAMDLVLPALVAARAQMPEATVEVVVATSDILAGQLLSGRLDFSLARVPEDADAALFAVEPLEAEPVALVVRRGHPLAGRSRLQAEQVLAHDWVMPAPDSILSRTVTARLRSLGLPMPRQWLSTASFLLTLASLQQSDAVAPLARAVADRFARAADAPYAVLDADLGIVVEPFGLITRANAALPPVAGRMVALIRAARMA